MVTRGPQKRRAVWRLALPLPISATLSLVKEFPVTLLGRALRAHFNYFLAGISNTKYFSELNHPFFNLYFSHYCPSTQRDYLKPRENI